jgi:hypothetical protein
MINYELIKETTFEDYQRNLTEVIKRLKKIEVQDKSGLLQRILNFDRQLLFSCMGKVLNVSDTMSVQNRDELSFFESLVHLFSYYLYDDGSLVIKYEKYNINKGIFVKCKKTDKRAKPYLIYASDNDMDLAGEKEILWLLDFIEDKNNAYLKSLKEAGMEDELNLREGKSYIQYL